MSTIKPFKALRPKKEYVHKIASPPYDVINSQEARKMAEGNSISFLHINKPEIDLPENIDLYDDRVYHKGKENLNNMITKRFFIQDQEEYIYIYRQKMGSHSQVGIVACCSCDDYENDIIKKHEKTREDKENDRTRHILTLDAQTGPVFITYRHDECIDTLVGQITREEPEYHFVSEDRIEHTFWLVKDREVINGLTGSFTAINPLYVADGHHRSASAVRVRNIKRDENKNHTGIEEYNFFLCVIFPDNQMNILPYNRAVKDLGGFSQEEFLNRVRKSFHLAKTGMAEPEKQHQISMYLNKNWYTLEALKNTYNPDDPVERLDCSILQNNLLDSVLGIKDPRKDKRIDFIGGIRGTQELVRLVDSGDFAAAFSMYPTSIEDLISIADAGKLMPPKSTWFEPKLRSGLAIHLI